MLTAVSIAALGVGTVAVAGLLIAVLVAVRSVGRRVDALHHELLDVRAEATSSVDDLRHEISRVSAQADRLADAAGLPPIDEKPRPVTRVPKMLRSKSVVKAMALGTGTAHAARRLRQGANGTNGNGNGNGRAR